MTFAYLWKDGTNQVMVKDSEKPSLNGQTQPNIQGLYTALDLMELGVELARQRLLGSTPKRMKLPSQPTLTNGSERRDPLSKVRSDIPALGERYRFVDDNLNNNLQ